MGALEGKVGFGPYEIDVNGRRVPSKDASSHAFSCSSMRHDTRCELVIHCSALIAESSALFSLERFRCRERREVSCKGRTCSLDGSRASTNYALRRERQWGQTLDCTETTTKTQTRTNQSTNQQKTSQRA